MGNPKIEITVDANGDWCGSFNRDEYLVSAEVLQALNDGLKTWHIERDFKEGIDFIKVNINENERFEKLADNYRVYGDC